jgi:F-type H+-transporting ATPase subunit b
MEVIQQIFSQFGVEWPKFLAQLILFIIVYTVLSKFAFKPIIAMLEERRKRIEEGMLNADKIKNQLAESETRYEEILKKANVDAQKLIDEARASSGVIAERKLQQAVADAEQIIAKAREASALEHDRVLSELKREVGRLVVDTTVKVTGKVLTADDQKRIADETARQVAA